MDTSKEMKVKKEEVTPAEDGADSRPQPEREQTVQVKKEEMSLTRNNESSEDEDVHVIEPRDGTDSTPPSDAAFKILCWNIHGKHWCGNGGEKTQSREYYVKVIRCVEGKGIT